MVWCVQFTQFVISPQSLTDHSFITASIDLLSICIITAGHFIDFFIDKIANRRRITASAASSVVSDQQSARLLISLQWSHSRWRIKNSSKISCQALQAGSSSYLAVETPAAAAGWDLYAMLLSKTVFFRSLSKELSSGHKLKKSYTLNADDIGSYRPTSNFCLYKNYACLSVLSVYSVMCVWVCVCLCVCLRACVCCVPSSDWKTDEVRGEYDMEQNWPQHSNYELQQLTQQSHNFWS